MIASAERPPRRPLVLMTADLDDAPAPTAEREYRLRANYAEAIAEAGGIALILPLERAQLEAALALADGILISGSVPGVDIAPQRREFELALVARALAQGKPLLGICHGMQLIGECLGGRVVRDDPALLAEATAHMPAPVPDVPAHDIVIEQGSALAIWYPAATARVNSLHRHALAEGGRFRVAARAGDGVVEAIEGLGPRFCLGVQWHPEYRLSTLDRCVMEHFVQHCAEPG
jgi:gamma-glutamyl-gamma-aminobutyrate hydrolase PuuD